LSTNKLIPKQLDILHVFEMISQNLKKLRIDFGEFDEIIRLIRVVTDAEEVALYMRKYSSTDDYAFERLGGTPAARQAETFSNKYTQESANSDLWNILNTEKPELFKHVQFSDREACNLYACPLYLESEPFGLFIFSGLKPEADFSVKMSFISSLCNIFELWLSKIDIRRRFDDVFDSFPNPSFVMASDEKVTAWNKANAEMTGWPAENIIGKDNYTSSLPYYNSRRPMVANLIMQPDTGWQSTYFEYSQEGGHVNALAFCPALPGGGAYLRTDTTRLYDWNNRLCGALHTVRDVTLERQMRENLQRSESMYRTIVDFAGVGILLVSDNEIIYSNERMEEFLGKSSDDLVFEDLLAWLQSKDLIDTKSLIKKLLYDKEGSARFEFQAERNNELCFFNALAHLITYENKNFIHFVIDDVSEQVELDRRARLNELKLFHEERLTSLGIMAAGIAHELNQPLNTVRVVTDGFLYCEEKGWRLDRDELIDNFELISKQVLRMSTVIQNIRNFSRDDQSEEFSCVYINDAVENVFSMIGRQLEAHGIRVYKSLAGDMLPVMAPLTQLEQVVTNLLINARQAFDFCDRDNWCIRLETDVRDNNVYLRVADNATGVPEPLLKKIFYPFYTTKEVGKGTGLGLSICQTIVASMKGKLDVYNNNEGGATFVVSIPLHRR
jgi:PAS domain S-box-containing protein